MPIVAVNGLQAVDYSTGRMQAIRGPAEPYQAWPPSACKHSMGEQGRATKRMSPRPATKRTVNRIFGIEARRRLGNGLPAAPARPCGFEDGHFTIPGPSPVVSCSASRTKQAVCGWSWRMEIDFACHVKTMGERGSAARRQRPRGFARMDAYRRGG